MTDPTQVPFVDLTREFEALRDDILPSVEEVMQRTDFILGDDVDRFEEAFAEYLGVEHCVGVGNGGDALYLALRAMGIGPGDEVVVPALTFVATIDAVLRTGATPVLADVEDASRLASRATVEPVVTDATEAIVPVHLHGRPCDHDPLLDLCEDRDIRLLEDAAQAHGARYRGKRVGSLGDAAGFSFYPAKNLGAYGDGGAIATDDPELADEVRKLRAYGEVVKHEHVVSGINSRLDTLQAAVLSEKLPHLDDWNERRREHARAYRKQLSGIPELMLPDPGPFDHIYHVFGIRHLDREALAEALEKRGISTGIHYPVPIHLQPAYEELGDTRGDFPTAEKICGELLSLPMFPLMTEGERDRVVQALREVAS